MHCQDLQWSQTYHNDHFPIGWDIGWQVFETNDSGFLVIGSTHDTMMIDSMTIEPRYHLLIIKTDEFGSTITKQMYCDTTFGVVGMLKLADDTLIALGLGLRRHGDYYTHTIRLLGLNQEGDSLFCEVIDTIELNGCSSALTNDGYIVSASYSITEDSLHEVDSLILFKHTIAGEIIWYRRYGLALGPDVVLQTRDGGFIVGGGTEHFQGWVMKCDSIGETLWTAYPPCQIISSIMETAPNEFLCVGGSMGIFVGKVIDGGYMPWFHYFQFDEAETSYTYTHSLIPTFDGNFVFCGSTGGYLITGGTFTYDTSDAFIMKIDSLGNSLWKRRIDIAGRWDYFYSVIQTQDSGYVCTGYASVCTDTEGTMCESLEVCLVKFSKDGDIIWENSMKIPERLSISASPNPFNTTTAISFSLPSAGDVSLEIYNILGNKLRTLVQKPFDAGAHRIVWNGADDMNVAVPSGVYFYRLQANGMTMTRKMALVK